MSIEAMKQALEALDGLSEPYDVLRAQHALRTAIEAAEKQEPLGYWNAVEGWVELPEEAQKPTAWVYPEALEAFQQGQPWTAYGTDGHGPNSDGVERIPLYTTPPAAQQGMTIDASAPIVMTPHPAFAHRSAAQRQPLTKEQVLKLWGPRSDGPDNHEIISFARAIEAAHGITGEKPDAA